jgi:DNA-directed RNA polymerase specialized sigma24 family protein
MADIASITEDQWREYQAWLTLCAGYFFAGCGWGSTAGPRGVTPDDIAAEAICRVLRRQRRYDPAKYPDLKLYLRGVVMSLVSHLAESAGVRRVRPFPQVQQDGTDDPVDMEPEGDEPAPSENCIRKETVDTLKTVAVGEQNDLVVRILTCLDAGITKPAEMAQHLGVPVRQINNAQKRLRRIAVEALGQPKQEIRS